MKKIEVHTNNSKFDNIMRISTLIISFIVACVLISQFNQTNKQIEIQEKGKTADRFRDGIELLKSDNDAVLVGGIYLLNNLAHDYPDDYASQVFEVFCGYLRSDTKLSWEKHIKEYKDNNLTDSLLLAKYEFPIKYQAIIEKAFKDSTKFYRKSIGNNYRINLKGVYLINADLSNVDFKGANLEASHMNWSILDFANLESASLRFAELKEISLISAILVRCDMTGAKLQGANFTLTHLQGARLVATSMEASTFLLAHLEGALLVCTHLEGSYFSKSHFEGACLWGTHFEGAIMSGINFKGANNNFGAIEMFLIDDELNKMGDPNKINLRGMSEYAEPELLLEYMGGHKLVFLKYRSGRQSLMLPKKNSSLKFGELSEVDIENIKTSLKKLNISKENQDFLTGFIKRGNNAKVNINGQFIDSLGLLKKEEANKIIKRVNKELGNI